MSVKEFSILGLTVLLAAESSGQEMQKAEEPEEIGLTRVWESLTANLDDSLPLTDADFRSGSASVTAERLKGNTPYCYTLTVKSDRKVVGRVSCVTDAVYYGKHTPLQIPNTAGEWKRVSLFFRSAPGTRSATIRFSRSGKGDLLEVKDPHLRAATEEEFSEAWQKWRSQYPQRDLSPRPDDGKNLQRFISLLQDPPPGVKKLLVYGIGSSYTNMLGNGERLQQWVREHFPKAPEIVYKKHVGSAVAYDFTRGWMRQLVLGEKPDLVILYSEGTGSDLEKLLKDFRRHSAAEVIVASLHLRERAKENTAATVHEPKWRQIKAVAKKYNCEWVDNRVEHAAYLKRRGKPLTWLLKDAVHQNDHGALVINENIVRHIAPQKVAPIQIVKTLPQHTSAYRIDLYGRKSSKGRISKVKFNGESAEKFPAFVTTLIVPGKGNHKPARGSTADRSPHMVKLGPLEKITPQKWTMKMTSDTGDYVLIGSVTGGDGRGNSASDFTSDSGQIEIPADLWRRRLNRDGSHSNRKGDAFSWMVRRSVLGEVDFSGRDGEVFRVTLAWQIPHGEWSVEVKPPDEGEGEIIGYELLQPALSDSSR